MTDTDAQITGEAIDALRDALRNSEMTASNVAAAKALLKQCAPPKTDEEQKNETEERDRAITEAHGFLEDLARYKLAFNCLQNALVTASKAPTDNAAGELARLADLSWSGLGKNENRS